MIYVNVQTRKYAYLLVRCCPPPAPAPPIDPIPGGDLHAHPAMRHPGFRMQLDRCFRAIRESALTTSSTAASPPMPVTDSIQSPTFGRLANHGLRSPAVVSRGSIVIDSGSPVSGWQAMTRVQPVQRGHGVETQTSGAGSHGNMSLCIYLLFHPSPCGRDLCFCPLLFSVHT